MSSVLAEICARKKEHVHNQKEKTSLQSIELAIKSQAKPRGFIKKIKEVASTRTAIIAEVKKASPSKGVIRQDFDPATIAMTYEDNGAACISVLTDEPYFQGHDEYLIAVKSAVSLPLLRKDFMIDPYQIYESRALGADCVLLIMAALDDTLARDLYMLSSELKMDTLFEIHNAEELERALALSPEMIGVNNRNLKTLKVDTDTSIHLSSLMPENILKVSESGISTPETIINLKTFNYQAFLVGESLMKQKDIGAGTRMLITNSI